ncbi:acyl-CoA thioesterase II [Mycolicibacterium sp. (ex Dasyatis americana)]|nr:acyl-CoA thioesterase II [Mycolicibacterium sp. (ex Dasyatis americana)]
MNTDRSQTDSSSVSQLLTLLDVELDSAGRATAETGIAQSDGRRIVEGAQIVGQAIVAMAKRCPDKSVRSAQAVFSRPVLLGDPVQLGIDVVSEGRTTSTAVVTASQNGRRCMVIVVLADVPSDDVIRHQIPCPMVSPPAQSQLCSMPLPGRQVRLVDAADAFSADETGPPEIRAWVGYDELPRRDDLRKAFIANFTGYLGIATSLRPHAGIGINQAHTTLSTAPLTATINFHEPVRCGGWMLYSHESTHSGAGMSYVRGTVHTEDGDFVASFSQEAMIRRMSPRGAEVTGHGRF